jgi:small-conductance mechanosensitive channel
MYLKFSSARWHFKRIGVLAGLIAALGVGLAAELADTNATNSPPEESLPTLTFANRRVCSFRATLGGYSPEERAAAAEARLHYVLGHAKTMLVTTQAVTNGIQILLDGKSLFIITPDDVFTIRGQTLESKSTAVAAALRDALKEYHSLSTPGEVLMAIGEAVFGLVLFAGLFWAVQRGKGWLFAYSARFAAEKTKEVHQRELRTAGLRSFVAVLRALLNFVSYLLLALLAYALIWFELRCFPYSRPWGDFLRAQCVAGLATLGDSFLEALPGLMIVVLIVLIARTLVQVLSRLFAVAERGEFQTRLLDPVTAATTRRILVFLLWVVAVVVAYPYIPGSQSLAFKGVTVFAGVIVSLGSSNLVNQIFSGLVLIYSHAIRARDYVRVGEIEGTVLDIGLCVTRVQTVKNEEVHIANSVLLGTATINYSQLAKSAGVLLAVKVTIGYSTPWRQVHALLLQAASRTPGLAAQPAPFVFQAALSDFYVEYELNACLEVPERRVWVLSDLQTQIQDAFNEYGVQIMSPHYLADPPAPQVVPKSNWSPPPAANSGANEPANARGQISQPGVGEARP